MAGMFTRPAALTFLVGLVTSAPGCSTEPRACEIETSKIAMYTFVENTGDGAVVDISLEIATGEGAGTQLELCPDKETITVNDREATLVRALGQVYYEVEFSTASSAYEVGLQRTDFADAVATIEMPPSFEVESPAPGSEHARSADLEIAWSPAWDGGVIDVAVEDEIGSSCIAGLGVELEVDDAGAYTLPAGALIGGTSGTQSCEVWISLARWAVGEYPPQLHADGAVVGVVKRRHAFVSTQ